ncbi:MAG: hypothetical protein ABSB40_06080 [Nitrososphaeria archaeon]
MTIALTRPHGTIIPEVTADATATGIVNDLEAVRIYAMKNSFHTKIKVKASIASTLGIARGKATL